MRIEIWADVICPWCYIGRARFEKSLAAFDRRDEVEVVHRSFELDPTRSSVEPLLDYLGAKFGARAAEMEDGVAALARAEGLEYRQDRMIGNTFDVHRLLHLAAAQGVQSSLLDTVLRANFGQARSLFDVESLVELADEAGVSDARKTLEDPEAFADEVRADELKARQLGVSGVPFVVLDGRLAVAGAQESETFTQALRQAFDG